MRPVQRSLPLPALSENANGHMGPNTRMGDPKGLFTRFRDLKAFPIFGLLLPPFLPDLWIAMEFIVFLLQLPQALGGLEDTCCSDGMHRSYQSPR